MPLAQGKVTIIDPEDWPRVAPYSWCVNLAMGKHYAVSRFPGTGKIVRMHRLILGIEDPAVHVDHRNGMTLDNRRCNLRPCTVAENLANSRRSSSNTSGFKGVSWATHANRWRALITHESSLRHLGYFGTPEDAGRAYDAAATRLKGEFARLNFPPAS